jgi:hypothetical protein
MNTLLRDLRHGVRQLEHRPGFAVAAIASLALGIGLNVSLCSVVNAVLLRDSAIARPIVSLKFMAASARRVLGAGDDGRAAGVLGRSGVHGHRTSILERRGSTNAARAGSSS